MSPGFTDYRELNVPSEERHGIIKMHSEGSGMGSRFVWGVSATVWLVVACAVGQVPTSVVAVTDDAAPGTEPGTTFTSYYGGFSAPIMGEDGRVSFTARLDGPAIHHDGDDLPTNDGGVWTGLPGSLRLVARVGDHAPGTPPGVELEALNGWGRAFDVTGTDPIGIHAELRGAGISSTGVDGYWVGNGQGLALLAREGDPAPGIPEATISALWRNWPVIMNRAGCAAFSAQLATPAGTAFALFTGAPGQVTPGPRTGQPAPGAPENVVFGGLFVPAINNSGQIFFYANLEGPGVDLSNRSGLWFGSSDNPQLVIRTGGQAPGFPAGSVFRDLHPNHERVTNDVGEVAFLGGVTLPTGDSQRVIFAGPAAALAPIAAEGWDAPGVPGHRFTSLWSPHLAADGTVAFAGTARPAGWTPYVEGIWAQRDGVLALVAGEGLEMAGLPDDTTLGYVSPYFVLSPTGLVAFSGQLMGLGVTGDNDGGLWVSGRDSALTLIAREGQQVEVRPGDWRTIADVASTSFNSHGELALITHFTDGTGAVLIAAVPEPGLPALLVLVALRRRR